jgi:hypothetical protein
MTPERAATVARFFFWSIRATVVVAAAESPQTNRPCVFASGMLRSHVFARMHRTFALPADSREIIDSYR